VRSREANSELPGDDPNLTTLIWFSKEMNAGGTKQHLRRPGSDSERELLTYLNDDVYERSWWSTAGLPRRGKAVVYLATCCLNGKKEQLLWRTTAVDGRFISAEKIEGQVSPLTTYPTYKNGVVRIRIV